MSTASFSFDHRICDVIIDSHYCSPLAHRGACLWWCAGLRPDEAFVYSGCPEQVRHTQSLDWFWGVCKMIDASRQL